MDETFDFQDPFLEITESDRGATVVLARLISIILSGSVVVIAFASRIKALKTLIPSAWLLVIATVKLSPINKYHGRLLTTGTGCRRF